MPHAIQIHETGGPEVLRWKEIEVGEPGPGQACIRQTACDLNFFDVYMRSGLYPLPKLPATFGMEAAGVIEAFGDGAKDLAQTHRDLKARKTTGSTVFLP